MNHVWHLVKHDLRVHRTILLAWLATVVALPVFAMLPWSDQVSAGFGVGAALLLQAVRVLLGMAAVAAIVQAGSPIDDRTFWRTRPIASRVLAAAHLLTVGVVFVVLPTLIVLVMAVAFGVPRTHWLATVAQVAVTEAAIVGLGLVMASRTRGLATFIIAAVAGLVSFYFFVGAMYEMRRVLEWPRLVQMADPLKGLWATLAIAALLLPLLFVVAMAGPRRQRASLAGVLGVLVLGVGVWFLPVLRFTPPPMVDAGLTFDAASIRIEAVPDSPGAVALVLVASPKKAHPRDEWRFWLKHGTLETVAGPRWLKGSPTGYAPRVRTGEHEVVLAILSASEFATLSGTRARLVASILGDVERHRTEASAAFAPGAILETDHQRLGLGRLLDGAADAGRRMRPIVQGTEIYLSSPRIAFRHGHAYVVRDRDSGCELTVYSWPTPNSRVMGLALLPTVMPPFTVMPTELAARVEPACRVGPSGAVIEMRTLETRTASTPPVSLEFTLPTSVPVP